MSSAARTSRTARSAAPSQRPTHSATRAGPVPSRVRSTAATEPASAPKTRPTRSAAPSAAPPSARPPLDTLTSLYTALHQLATLRSATSVADDAFRTSKESLTSEVDALEQEVGETRARREVERQLELLNELEDVNTETTDALKMATEVLGQSSALLEGVEGGLLGSRDARDATYPLQLLLAECSTRLGRLELAAQPQLAVLLPSLKALVDLRLELLTATRFNLEQDLKTRRVQSSEAIKSLQALN